MPQRDHRVCIRRMPGTQSHCIRDDGELEMYQDKAFLRPLFSPQFSLSLEKALGEILKIIKYFFYTDNLNLFLSY